MNWRVFVLSPVVVGDALGVGCSFLGLVLAPGDAGWLSGKQFGNADQVIGDQIELAATRAVPRCLVLRMVPCCLPHSNMHSTIARRDCDMPGPPTVSDC